MLVTHAGKVGDLLWSLATVKEIAKSTPVVLEIPAYLKPILPFLKAQPYITNAFYNPHWEVEFNAPVTPRVPPNFNVLGEVLHLGYEGWPTPTLIQDHARRAGVSVDPETPWLSPLGASNTVPSRDCVGVHFSDEWFELKAGIVLGLIKHFGGQRIRIYTYEGSRWAKEVTYPFMDVSFVYTSQSGLSDWLGECKVLVTCKSFARVMNLGLGGRNLVVEPSPPRHQAVFDLDKPHSRERIINGFDLRQVCQTLEGML